MTHASSTTHAMTQRQLCTRIKHARITQQHAGSNTCNNENAQIKAMKKTGNIEYAYAKTHAMTHSHNKDTHALNTYAMTHRH